jgi:cation diffusion facilitator family transporter
MAWLSIATSIATLLLKFGAYALTGAVSLLSDALEALVNMAAGLVALVALTIAERPPDDDHPYGHEKAEYFSSGAEGLLVVAAALAIAWTAAGHLVEPAELGALGPGLVVAALAATLNLVTSRLMMRVAREHDSIVLEADAKHLMTDVWTSAGVIAGLAVVMVAPQWRILDPLIALAVAAHVLWTGLGLLRRSAGGLMDAALAPDELATIRATVEGALPPGASMAALRTRRSGAKRFVEFVLCVPGEQTVAAAHELCDRLEALLGERLPRAAVTIHVEPAPDHGAADAAPWAEVSRAAPSASR